jgi:bacteriorhodopsin
MVEATLRRRLLLLSALWFTVVIGLLLIGSQERTQWLFAKYDQLQTIYLGTATAFCFAIVLDILAYKYAVNEAKKTLALVLTFVDTIAAITYAISASTSAYYFVDEFTNPVWVIRYAGKMTGFETCFKLYSKLACSIEWMVTCPLLLVIVALAASAPMEQVLDLLIFDTCLNTLGLLSSVVGGKIGVVCFALASLLFVVLLWRVSNVIQQSTAEGKFILASLGSAFHLRFSKVASHLPPSPS